MSGPAPGDIFTRHPQNPIISANDLPYRANSVFNPGAGLVGGQTLLLLRVEDLRGISHLLPARSVDGSNRQSVAPRRARPGTPPGGSMGLRGSAPDMAR